MPHSKNASNPIMATKKRLFISTPLLDPKLYKTPPAAHWFHPTIICFAGCLSNLPSNSRYARRHGCHATRQFLRKVFNYSISDFPEKYTNVSRPLPLSYNGLQDSLRCASYTSEILPLQRMWIDVHGRPAWPFVLGRRGSSAGHCGKWQSGQEIDPCVG